MILTQKLIKHLFDALLFLWNSIISTDFFQNFKTHFLFYTMQFDLDGIPIIFPYLCSFYCNDYRFKSLYPEQYEYMLFLKEILSSKEQKKHALLEMPTGTGKTVCIFSLYLAMKQINPSMGN